jgi:hypothetical protein
MSFFRDTTQLLREHGFTRRLWKLQRPRRGGRNSGHGDGATRSPANSVAGTATSFSTATKGLIPPFRDLVRTPTSLPPRP